MIEDLVGQQFFQVDNKSYFIAKNNTETYYGMELVTNQMRPNHKTVLKQFLKEKGLGRKKDWAYAFRTYRVYQRLRVIDFI